MTAPNGSILFNNSTGSDTTASGLGAANVYGAGASTTGASAVVTGISTTGIRAGDLLWVQSSSGRQFSIIASVDSSTQVTCDDNFDNTESGRTWAIGGKRATWENSDSRQAFRDCYGKGWEFVTETNQTINSVVRFGGGAAGLPTIVRGSTGDEIITQTSNTSAIASGDPSTGLGSNYLVLEDLVFENTSSSKSLAYCFLYTGNYVRLHRLKTISQTNNHQRFLQRENGGTYLTFDSCTITHCISHGIYADRLLAMTFTGCYIANNGGYGIYSNRTITLIDKCILANNSNDGLFVNNAVVMNTIFYGNGGDGMNPYYLTPTIGCVFYNNSGYGIECGPVGEQLTLNSNAFGANSLGAINVSNSWETNTITLTADPFVSAANGNFNLNDFPGGGNLLRAKYYELGGN